MRSVCSVREATPGAVLAGLGARQDAIVPYQPWHLDSLTPRVCSLHRERAERVGTFDAVLEAVLPISRLLRTGMIDGRPECIMGLALADDSGWPWLLKSDVAERRHMRLIRHCREFIAECHAVRPVLRAEVDPEDAQLRRWLAWLGFEKTGMREQFARWERVRWA